MNSLMIQLEFPPDIKNIRSYVEGILKFICNDTQNEETLIKIEIVLTELLNNIVIHGIVNPIYNDNNIKINIKASVNFITFIILDLGVNYIKQIKKLSFDETSNLFETSGRGRRLIQMLADFITYKRVNGINITTLKMNI
ncbi:MAG: ATP-binding protein [bacterium]|nr:ATP-binding protein [bacterium]